MTWQGWLGVEIFFVISGFVIPYSMHQRSYRLRDAGGFLVRRLKRLEPPYLACILLILLLNWLWTIVPGMSAKSQNVTAPQLFAHLGYLNAILKDINSSWEFEWLNPVFWTLAIEFQFYIFMALVFPLLVHKRTAVRVAAVAAVALVGFIDSEEPGAVAALVAAVRDRHRRISVVCGQTANGLGGSADDRDRRAVMAYRGGTADCRGAGDGPLDSAAGRTCEMPRVLTPLMFLGTISYSLYLLHIPIGRRSFTSPLRRRMRTRCAISSLRRARGVGGSGVDLLVRRRKAVAGVGEVVSVTTSRAGELSSSSPHPALSRKEREIKSRHSSPYRPPL